MKNAVPVDIEGMRTHPSYRRNGDAYCIDTSDDSLERFADIHEAD